MMGHAVQERPPSLPKYRPPGRRMPEQYRGSHGRWPAGEPAARGGGWDVASVAGHSVRDPRRTDACSRTGTSSRGASA